MSTTFLPQIEQGNKNAMYINTNRVFSFGTRYIIIVGGRGIGKTYRFTKFVIKKFLTENKKFAWVRDTERALDTLTAMNGAKFFKGMSKEFKKFNGKIDGEAVYINDELAGYMLPLSTYYNYKGNNYDDVDYIIIDEFIAETQQRITFSRAQAIINTIETIARLRPDVRVILLANALDRGDEILQLFGFNIKDFGYYLNREKSAVLWYPPSNPQYLAKHTTSLAGLLTKGTVYDDNIIANKFINESPDTYARRPAKASVLIVLHNEDSAVRVYIAGDDIYIDRDTNAEAYAGLRYVTDYRLVSTRRNLLPQGMKKGLLNAYANGSIKFANPFVRNVFLEILNK